VTITKLPKTDFEKDYCCCFLGFKGRDVIPKLSGEYMAGKLKLDELITHTMPLDNLNDAFDLMRTGKRFVELSNILGADSHIKVSGRLIK